MSEKAERMSEDHVVTKDEVSAVYPEVAKAIAEALGRNADDIELESRLVGDLNAESIDFLDIVFRLERAFRIKIPRGEIVQDARGNLPEEEFAVKGCLTEVGLARLREYLDEIPPENFRHPMRVSEVPLLFTVETFAKLVVRARRQGAAEKEGQDHGFPPR
jgi:acyl carrier protein